MNDTELQNSMIETIVDYFKDTIETCETYEDFGVLTTDKGLVLGFEDGSEFQVTIKQVKRGEQNV